MFTLIKSFFTPCILTLFMFLNYNSQVLAHQTIEELQNQQFPSTSNQTCFSYSSMSIANYEVYKNKTTIVLNNGLIGEYYDTDLFAQPGGWEIGDMIQIVYVYTGGYYLKNNSFQGQIPIKILNSESKDIQSLLIKSIKKLPAKNEKSKSYSYQITLEDNSEWFVGPWSGHWMLDWVEGDRVLLTSHEFLWGEANTLIINLDKMMIDPLYNLTLPLCSNVRAHQKGCLGIEPPEIQFPKLRPVSTWKTEIQNISFMDGLFLIELNNKTIWKSSSIKDLAHWKIGEEVFLNSGNSILSMTNNHGEKIKVTFSKFQSQSVNTPTIQKILKHGNKLILSDGSIWFKNTSKSVFQNWKENDRILISPLQHSSYDTSTHLLINLDRLHDAKENPSLLSHYEATLIR